MPKKLTFDLAVGFLLESKALASSLAQGAGLFCFTQFTCGWCVFAWPLGLLQGFGVLTFELRLLTCPPVGRVVAGLALGGCPGSPGNARVHCRVCDCLRKCLCICCPSPCTHDHCCPEHRVSGRAWGPLASALGIGDAPPSPRQPLPGAWPSLLLLRCWPSGLRWALSCSPFPGDSLFNQGFAVTPTSSQALTLAELQIHCAKFLLQGDGECCIWPQEGCFLT